MFRTYRVQLGQFLKEQNPSIELYLVFDSAFIRGRQTQEALLGRGKQGICWNGDPSRVFVRKAPYHLTTDESTADGWDWGPHLSTAGPWRPIRIESYDRRIKDFHPQATVAKDLSAELTFDVETACVEQVRISIMDPNGRIIRKHTATSNQRHCRRERIRFERDEVALWWPSGIGQQPLYKAKAVLTDEKGKVIHEVTKTFGFRSIKVIQERFASEDELGKSFCFRVNGRKIFCGGSNWIPIDSFLTHATEKRYRRLLTLLVDGHQNMIRVWGGGIFENDEFYQICDELGILVWQDCLFACGLYPAHDDFIASVKREVEDNVRRIRSHPCLAIFAGNNEDYQIAESEHAVGPDFPARVLYETKLPDLISSLTDVFYHPGSPFGGKTSSDPTVGDIHQWNIWHGTQEPYQNWDRLAGRFVSEFGMLSLPDTRTVDSFLNGNDRERHPQSRLMAAHTKAAGYERRLALYLTENIRFGTSLEDYVFATQFIQAEAMHMAFRLWRARFRGPGKAYTAGALVWQLNDVWPCSSWSIVDYYLRPKPAYYAIKRAMAPLAISIQRQFVRHYPNRFSQAEYHDHGQVEIWLLNSFLRQQRLRMHIRCIEIQSGRVIWSKTYDNVLLGDNRATEFLEPRLNQFLTQTIEPICIDLRLSENDGQVLARYVSWPQPFKFVHFAKPYDVKLVIQADVESQSIIVSSSRPVKGLFLKFEPELDYISDNGIDVMPDDVQILTTRGLEALTKITYRYLGDKHVP
ncbi:hypothetical protein OIO90_000327 [Microbotryomycetes sp. JL221]|nr:hypothetical protein OIO90_000327 [Microbotryomycetes sp. JL221]